MNVTHTDTKTLQLSMSQNIKTDRESNMMKKLISGEEVPGHASQRLFK